MHRLTLFLGSLLLSLHAHAVSLADLSQQDTGTALKQALDQGISLAVAQLGKPGGFSNDPAVRIELPGNLAKVASSMKMMPRRFGERPCMGRGRRRGFHLAYTIATRPR